MDARASVGDLMKRIATLMLVMVFALVGTMAAKPQRISPQENAPVKEGHQEAPEDVEQGE